MAVHRRPRVATGPDLKAIIARGRARRTVDGRPEDEILGYDEHGLLSAAPLLFKGTDFAQTDLASYRS